MEHRSLFPTRLPPPSTASGSPYIACVQETEIRSIAASTLDRDLQETFHEQLFIVLLIFEDTQILRRCISVPAAEAGDGAWTSTGLLGRDKSKGVAEAHRAWSPWDSPQHSLLQYGPNGNISTSFLPNCSSALPLAPGHMKIRMCSL